VSYTGTSRLHGQHGIQCYSTSMQVPPTWPVALEGIPGVASSSWKPAETAFLQARKDGFTGVQTTSFKHTMKTYHNILDCCNFLSSQFHVCVFGSSVHTKHTTRAAGCASCLDGLLDMAG
jgi:hypothetical protein